MINRQLQIGTVRGGEKVRYKLLVALLAGGILFACAACSPAGESATPIPSVTQVATLEPTSGIVVESTLECTVEPTVEPIIEPTVEPTVEPTLIPTASGVDIDLSDPVIYRKLNIFLSNFSESGFSYFGNFSIDAPDYNNLVSFAYMHAEINSPSMVEGCDEMQDGDYVNRRMAKTNILKVLKRFFGDSIDSDRVAKICPNGYYYGIMTNGAFYGEAFTLADSVIGLGENRFEVKFHTYGVPGAEFQVYDSSSTSSVYSAHPNDLPRPEPADIFPEFTATPGTAVIEATPQKDGSLHFLLRSYTI